MIFLKNEYVSKGIRDNIKEQYGVGFKAHVSHARTGKKLYVGNYNHDTIKVAEAEANLYVATRAQAGEEAANKAILVFLEEL